MAVIPGAIVPGADRPTWGTQQTIADSNGAGILEELHRIYNDRWPDSKRDAYNQSHPGRFAGPGKSFPIETAQDVRSAGKLYGKAADPSAVKSKVIAIAKDLDLTKYLPQTWKEEDDSLPSDDDDGPDTDWDEASSSYGMTLASPQEAKISEACFIREDQQIDAVGHEIVVTILKGGPSINRYSYSESILQQIARMIEGAQAYADHGPPDQMVRSVKDLVGYYHNATYVPPSGGQPGRVDAVFHVLENASWLWSIIQESFKTGIPNLIGLSIDIFGQWTLNPATQVKDVNSIVQLGSCDVVTRPSAGGAFTRILHHNDGGNTVDPKEEDKNKNKDQNNVQTQDPPALPADKTQATNEQIQEAIKQSNEMLKTMQELDQQKAKLAELDKELKLGKSQLFLNTQIQESILPEAVKEKIVKEFEGRIFEASELQNAITSAIDMMAKLAQSGIVRGHNYEKVQIGDQITEAEKIQAAFDLMFGNEIDTAKLGNIKGFTSIRDAYFRVTGDSQVSGIHGGSLLGDIRIHESAPITRISEADTTTATFSYLLGTSMNKRLLKDYQSWPAEWTKFCAVVPIRDFKQQTRVRLGAFGSLPVVAEDTAYQAVTLNDTASTYVPQKRGNLVTVSRETIINDDLQAIKQIPTKLAVAAAYTLAEFVYGFLSSNPNIYDGNALFTSGGAHNNLGSSALSTSAMQTGVTAMREQTNYAGKRLGLRPRFLVVPAELEFAAMIITKSAGVPGSVNNDINPMLGYCTPIVSPQLSNTSQWFLIGDPREIDTIEIGFVGGQVNPALFIQDQPLKNELQLKKAA